MCNSGEPESESHFLLCCEMLGEERLRFPANNDMIIPACDVEEEEMLITMFEGNNVRTTSEYIEILMEKRNSILYDSN